MTRKESACRKVVDEAGFWVYSTFLPERAHRRCDQPFQEKRYYTLWGSDRVPDLLLISFFLRHCCGFFCKGRRADSHQSIISLSDGALPRKPCKTCKNLFHSSCLYKVCVTIEILDVRFSSILSVVDQNKSFSDMSSMSVGNHVTRSGSWSRCWSCLSFWTIM